MHVELGAILAGEARRTGKPDRQTLIYFGAIQRETGAGRRGAGGGGAGR